MNPIIFFNYKIEKSTNATGKPVARFYKLITVGKNKGQYQQIEGLYFASEERRQEYIIKTVQKMTQQERQKQQQADLKKEIAASQEHPYIKGQILYDSWGYDQTNIDFYIITEVKPKTITIQKIGESIVPGSEGNMSECVTPDPTRKIGVPLTKAVQFYLQDNKPSYYIKSPHSGHLAPYTAGSKGLYQSHYA